MGRGRCLPTNQLGADQLVAVCVYNPLCPPCIIITIEEHSSKGEIDNNVLGRQVISNSGYVRVRNDDWGNCGMICRGRVFALRRWLNPLALSLGDNVVRNNMSLIVAHARCLAAPASIPCHIQPVPLVQNRYAGSRLHSAVACVLECQPCQDGHHVSEAGVQLQSTPRNCARSRHVKA